jgi:endo-1,4-beta-D-glucanase Y
MNRHLLRALRLGLLSASVVLTAASVSAQNQPFPRHVAYPGASIYPNHRTQAQKDADVRAYYDYWKQNYLVTAGTASDGTQLWRVTMGSDDPGRTTSEGMGYGMKIVTFMAGYDPQAQAIFNGLWKFVRSHPSVIDNRLMAWEVPEGTGADSAFDGDCDIAYALLLADKQWGSSGAVNYQAAALTLIGAIKASTIGPTSRLPMLGDWVSPNGSLRNQYSPRTSDFMLANFRAFATATGDSTWATVVANSQAAINHLQATYSATPGLLPDFTEKTSSTDTRPKPARSNFLEGPDDGKYTYNAARVPWRLGIDALLNNNATSLAEVRKISSWAQTKTGANPFMFKEPGYTLAGAAINSSWGFSSVFGAPLGVAAMTGATQQQWLNALYDAVYTNHEGYYADSITMICLLIMTGNHWDITTQTADVTPPAVDITYPMSGSVVTGDIASVNGTASDTSSGVQRVEIQFYRPMPGGGPDDWEWWNGSYWDWSDPTLPTTLNTSTTPNTWTRSGGLPTGANFPAGIYYVRAVAFDTAGNASVPLYIDFTKQ